VARPDFSHLWCEPWIPSHAVIGPRSGWWHDRREDVVAGENAVRKQRQGLGIPIKRA